MSEIRIQNSEMTASEPGVADSRRREKVDGAMAGFSLLEVMVATAIVAIVFVSMMQIFSSGLRTGGLADEYSTAMLHATRVMNDWMVSPPRPWPSTSEGKFDDGTAWRATVDFFHPPEVAADHPPAPPFDPILLHVEVTWTSRGVERKVQLDSLKNVPRESSKS